MISLCISQVKTIFFTVSCFITSMTTIFLKKGKLYWTLWTSKKIIKFIGRKNILDADEFYIRYKENRLNNNHVCFTFDDGIKAQI